jgi:hypothetical protein
MQKSGLMAGLSVFIQGVSHFFQMRHPLFSVRPAAHILSFY